MVHRRHLLRLLESYLARHPEEQAPVHHARRRPRTGAPPERGVDGAPVVRAAAADDGPDGEEPAPHGEEDAHRPGEILMIEWSEQHELIRQTFRRFVEAEIKPNLRELEHG